jgi:glutamate--cysteine ligase
MEDKFMSKLVLSEAGLRVPPGKHYHRPADALADLAFYGGRPIVVKPTTTNFGTGITVLHDYDAAEYERAVETAFRFGSAVIVEQFVAGMEYRFLVIGNECVAVANRIPANVQGDGTSNIRELVTRKNEDPRRGVGHVTPLEKIQLGDTELDFLASQGLSPDSVPAAGERVFLRRNSNISTGGDSLDCTDEVASGYRELAVRAAGSAGAQICGVDIIAPDLTAPPTTDNYAILEINFNPVLYIHNFPYQGKNRQVGEKILDLLGY